MQNNTLSMAVGVRKKYDNEKLVMIDINYVNKHNDTNCLVRQ